MMKQGQLFLIPLVLSLLATTCLSLESEGEDRVLQGNNCRSVRDIICSTPDTNTFCEMVTKASDEYSEFSEGLDGARPYTVFAPTDEAFERYEGELLSLKDTELFRTLLFHFYEDIALKGDDLGCQGKLVSLTGDMSRTKCKRITAGVYTKHQRGRGNKAIGDFPEIDLATSADACSGVVHKISHVLLPIAFKPFKPYLIEVDEAVAVPEEEDSEEEDEDEAEVIKVDVIEEENAVTASSICLFNCPPAPAPTSAPAPASICLFNCDTSPTAAPAPLCLFNCDTSPTAAPAPLCLFNCPVDEPAVEEAVAEPVAEEVEEEEAPAFKPPLKGNGVFLIIVGLILLCFIFFCLRK